MSLWTTNIVGSFSHYLRVFAGALGQRRQKDKWSHADEMLTLIQAHTSWQGCETIAGSLAVPWLVSNWLSVSSTTVCLQSGKVRNLAQSSALDFSPRGWPGETVNCPKCSWGLLVLSWKVHNPCPLVATEGAVEVRAFVFDANMHQWYLRTNNIFDANMRLWVNVLQLTFH